MDGEFVRINVGSDDEPDWVRVTSLPIGCEITFEDGSWPWTMYVPPAAVPALSEAIQRLGGEGE